MSATIEGRARELLSQPNFAHVSTLRADGSPHSTLTWVDVEDGTIMLNSAEGRAWPANAARDGRISLLVPSSENPYEYVSIRGHVTEITADGADDHADALATKYLGVDEYPFRQPGEVRLIVRVEPDHVFHMAPG